MASVYLYPVWVRLWHLVNALLYLFLIITGLSMQYSNPEYPMIRFDIAVSMHNISGILLTAKLPGHFLRKYVYQKWLLLPDEKALAEKGNPGSGFIIMCLAFSAVKKRHILSTAGGSSTRSRKSHILQFFIS